MDLGLSKEEFYLLQPRQLDALIKRNTDRLEDQEYMLGQLTATVVNFSMCHPKTPSSAADFMPSQIRKKMVAQPEKRRTHQQIADEIRATMRSFMKK